MKTTVSYTLYFSRESNYLPFLEKRTVIWKGWKIIHAHSAKIEPVFDFELKWLWEDFRNFRREESDTTEIAFNNLEICKTMTVTKTWEG